jgi:hypothetical protein
MINSAALPQFRQQQFQLTQSFGQILNFGGSRLILFID